MTFDYVFFVYMHVNTKYSIAFILIPACSEKCCAILNNYIEDEKPYLEFEISLQDLSDKLSISPRNLSHIINKKYERNFYDFINHYRIELVKLSLQESNKPIKEIMYDCGFSNKATFNSIFKKNIGLTPTQFREKQNS